VPSQSEKEATTRRNPLHSFFSILHLFVVSLSPSLSFSLIFPSCRFHHFLDRQRATRSRRMMKMTTRATTTAVMLLSTTTTRRSNSNDDDAKSIPSYASAKARWFANAHTLSRSFCTISNRDDDDDFQSTWCFVLIHCVFSLLCVCMCVCMQSFCKQPNASKRGST
jgi:hypothetical protein